MLLLSALLLAPEAAAERIAPKGFPFALTLPDARWLRMKEDEAEVVVCAAYGMPPCFVLSYETGFQPDLARVDLAEINRLAPDLEDFVPAFRREAHPVLGNVLLAESRSREQTFMGQPADFRMIVFELHEGMGFVGGIGLAGRGRIDARLAEVLGAIEVLAPPLPKEKHQVGHVALGSGYTIDLADGWRGATPRESDDCGHTVLTRGSRQGERSCHLFFDPAAVEMPASFTCVTNSEDFPLEVLAPEKSQLHASNIRNRLAALASGRAFTRMEGLRATYVDVVGGGETISVSPKDGELTVLPLGDREGYLWRVKEDRHDGPTDTAFVYTAWDDVSLVCSARARSGHPEDVEAAVAAFRTIRVTEGDAHPMRLEWLTRYKRWWPYTHPALQLYWGVLAGVVVGIGVSVKMLFSD